MRTKAPLAASVVTAGILLSSCLGASPARAMDILYFARMNLDDQATYVSTLVAGTAKMLRTTGHPDKAERAIALFKDTGSHGGVAQLAANLKHLQLANTINSAASNQRNLPVYDVEAALQLTLRNAGVDVPLKFLETVNRDFAPQFPLRQHA